MHYWWVIQAASRSIVPMAVDNLTLPLFSQISYVVLSTSVDICYRGAMWVGKGVGVICILLAQVH